MIQEFSNGKDPNRSINPDEAVEYGAAVQGAILTGEGSHESEGLAVIGCDSFAYGLECSWLMMLEGTYDAHVMVIILFGIILVS